MILKIIERQGKESSGLTRSHTITQITNSSGLELSSHCRQPFCGFSHFPIEAPSTEKLWNHSPRFSLLAGAWWCGGSSRASSSSCLCPISSWSLTQHSRHLIHHRSYAGEPSALCPGRSARCPCKSAFFQTIVNVARADHHPYGLHVIITHQISEKGASVFIWQKNKFQFSCKTKQTN